MIGSYLFEIANLLHSLSLELHERGCQFWLHTAPLHLLTPCPSSSLGMGQKQIDDWLGNQVQLDILAIPLDCFHYYQGKREHCINECTYELGTCSKENTHDLFVNQIEINLPNFV